MCWCFDSGIKLGEGTVILLNLGLNCKMYIGVFEIQSLGTYVICIHKLCDISCHLIYTFSDTLLSNPLESFVNAVI